MTTDQWFFLVGDVLLALILIVLLINGRYRP